MEINADELPPGMHIIAAVETYGLDSTDISSSSTILLSSTGELNLYHPNHIISSVIPCASLDDITSIEDRARVIHHPVKLLVWKASFIYSIFTVGLLLTVFALTFFAQITEGYISISSSGASSPVTSDDVVEGVVDGLEGLFVMSIVLAPYFYCLICSAFLPVYVSPRMLILTKSTGEKLVVSDHSEWGQWMERLMTMVGWVILGIVLVSIPASELVVLIIYIAIVVGAMYFFAWGFKLLVGGSDESERGELSTGNLQRFARVMNDLHSKPESDVSTHGDTTSQIGSKTSVKDRMGTKIAKQIDVLYAHSEMLDELTDNEWEAIFTANKFYFAMTQIRRCTELMLSKLTSRAGIKIKSSKLGIKTLQERLLQNELLPPHASKWVGVIRELTNPNAHYMVEDADDLVSALAAFASFTTYYVNQGNQEEE